MKNTIQVLFLASLLFGAGCAESKKEAASGAGAGNNTSLPVTTSSSSSAPVISSQPAATVSQPVTSPQPAVTAGLNPAHGQPGHRCDIPVGAGLDSPPGATANSSAATPSASRPATLPPAPVLPVGPPVVTAKGMNPPHGQPGHDCSIPVGAPLKK
ncbi:hypothetical protein [Rufibacter aurantiacus]|uniref:hypothetical protein n=1 Tax=Rufibacter aurantiacus TaxID=2817374 RepID=UPI001B30B057|nr:hypothetical protein [Rufibacter aurantiacus]